ncbi:MAG: DUF2510 domain-containing protein [Acidimicrobiales bacterium]
MTDTPPGWFDDPEDPSQYRYWDGSVWTDHRSPKFTGGTHTSVPGRFGSVWALIGAAFSLLASAAKRLLLVAVPVLLIAVMGVGLLLGGLDRALSPGLSTIVDRVTEAGFDPVDDPADEAFVESIEFDASPEALSLFALGAAVSIVGWLVGSVAISVQLASARLADPLSVGATFGHALRRLPRVLGVRVLWALGLVLVAIPVVLVVALLIALTPATLLLSLPLILAAIILAWPVFTIGSTGLMVGPTDTPPLRTAYAIVRDQWGRVALRILVVNLVVMAIGAGVNTTATPFRGAALSAAVLIMSGVVQLVQTAIGAAMNLLVYDDAGGVIDPALVAGT